MRIIFVGIHNKPNLQPLYSSTKTGKLVNRIIDKLPNNFEIKKTNLFNVDYFPNQEDIIDLAYEWYWENLPTDEDIIVLLGSVTHKEFRFELKNLVKIAHPASKRSHEEMDKYVLNSVEKIMKYIKMKLIIIAALSIDGVIGMDDNMLWRIPEDFKHYKETTMGNTLIVGRITFQSLPIKAHEGRKFIILSHGESLNLNKEQYQQFNSIDIALESLNHCDLNKVFVIGGASIYEALIDYCDEAIITWVNKTYPNGNKKFPINKLFINFTALNDSNWITSKNNYEYKIIKYVRNGSKGETQTKTDNNT